MNEFSLIKKISKLPSSSIKKNCGVVGIGDDAAVIPIDKKKSYLISVDNLYEGIHFNLKHTSMFELGMKSVKVNVSDILSTGGIPVYALISINIPPKLEITSFFKGCDSACKKYNISIIGGDTAASSSGLCISITVIGIAQNNKIILRNKVKPEQLICMTGWVGLSGTGFNVLNNKLPNPQKYFPAIKFHNNPEIANIEAACMIRNNASAAMDNSDGLYFTVYTLLKSSGVGGQIFFDKIPLHPLAECYCSEYGFDPQTLINFGEDYNCVFTVDKVKKNMIERFAKKITIIGTTELNKKIVILQNGKIKQLRQEGFKHNV